MIIKMNDGKQLFVDDSMAASMHRAAKMANVPGKNSGPMLGWIKGDQVTAWAFAENEEHAAWIKRLPHKWPVQFIGFWAFTTNPDGRLTGPADFGCSQELASDMEPHGGSYVVVFGPSEGTAYWSKLNP